MVVIYIGFVRNESSQIRDNNEFWNKFTIDRTLRLLATKGYQRNLKV